MDHPKLRLPWELLDMFVDELAALESRQALYNCALVCHSFHFRASGYIFSNVVVSKAGSWDNEHKHFSNRLRELRQLMMANPTIGPRVQSFTIETSSGKFDPNVGTRSLIMDNPNLPKILAELTTLRHFGWLNHRLALQWDALGEGVLNALRRLFERPSMRSLALECFDNLNPVDVARCTTLTHLRLMHVDPPAKYDAPREGLSLQSLTEYNSAAMITALIGNAGLAGLRELSVWMRHGEQVAASWALMQRAAPTLEVLDIPELSHFRYPTLIPGPINLGILRRLRAISMACRLVTLDRVVFPMGICGLLRTPIEATRIERVSLKLDWVDCSVGSEEARFLREPGWEALDDTLAQKDIYPALKVVDITLRMGYGWIEDAEGRPPNRVYHIKDTVERLAARLLAKVAESGAVKVSVNLLLYKSKYVSDSAYI